MHMKFGYIKKKKNSEQTVIKNLIKRYKMLISEFRIKCLLSPQLHVIFIMSITV